MRLVAPVVLLTLFILSCGGNGRPSIPEGEAFEVQAADLNRLIGQEELKGSAVVTIRDAESVRAIEDEACGSGSMRPRGKFIVVYYTIENNLNQEIQPSTQVADGVRIGDFEGNSWQQADFAGDYCFLAANAARRRGYDGPEAYIGSGFSGTTSMVFDVPTDAENLRLRFPSVDVELRP